jgi:hypothetical protein
MQKLAWLWNQYNKFKAKKIDVNLPLQNFEIELTTLYQRYSIKIISQNQYHITTPILEFLIDNFSIKHSHFSLPITCHTSITSYNSFNQIFGSKGPAFQYKWEGISLIHPPNSKLAQQAIHWARLVAKENIKNIKIIILPGINWYNNKTPHLPIYQDTYIIQLKYKTPLNPIEK